MKFFNLLLIHCNLINIRHWYCFFCLFIVIFPEFVMASLGQGGANAEGQGIAVQDADAAVRGLHAEIFNPRWVIIAEIASCVTGLVLSLRSMTLTPFAASIGVTAAIHFFKTHTAASLALLIP